MDATWLKDHSDFLLMGFGAASGICWMIWKAARSIYEKKRGPSENSGVTKGDLTTLNITIGDGFKSMDERMDTMDTSVAEIKSDVRSLGERAERLESRQRSTEKKTSTNSESIADIRGELRASSKV